MSQQFFNPVIPRRRGLRIALVILGLLVGLVLTALMNHVIASIVADNHAERMAEAGYDQTAIDVARPSSYRDMMLTLYIWELFPIAIIGIGYFGLRSLSRPKSASGPAANAD